MGTTSQAGDWIVDDDGGPGVDFVDIQPAIHAAAPWDRILIRDGFYSTFVIDNKPLTLSRQGPGQAVAFHGLIRNLQAGDGVQLDHITLIEPGFTRALSVEDCVGSVWLYDCELRVGVGPFAGWSALAVINSADVGVVRCTAVGGAGADGDPNGNSDGEWGGSGLATYESTVQCFDSLLEGGTAGAAGNSTGYDGWHGSGVSAVVGSTLFLSRCSVLAGSQVVPSDPCRPIWYFQSQVRHFESTFASVVGAPLLPNPPLPPEADTTAFCFGSPSACSCTGGGLGGGCRNSYGNTGGQLSLSGNASVGADTITLLHRGLPAGKPLLFFQGTQAVGNGLGTSLGDGLLCAGGSILRLATRLSSGGQDAFGFGVGNDPLISVAGLIPSIGATRYYQVWYRDPNAACASGGGSGAFNLSNGLLIPWMP